MNTLKIVLLFGCLISCMLSYSQNFKTTLSIPNIDFNHYSIETSLSHDYIVAGTIFTSDTTTDIHVLKIDTLGNIVWEKTFDLSEKDRGLDLAIDNNNDIIVTGYIKNDGRPHSLYVLKLDNSGNYINDKQIDIMHLGDTINSAGTNVIYSFNRNAYVLGGFYSRNFSYMLDQENQAMLLELDKSTLNVSVFRHLGYDHNDSNTVINDIIEIPKNVTTNKPGGFFVTGTSYSLNSATGVLALFIKDGYNQHINMSFTSENVFEHCGVSAALAHHDGSKDNIVFLLSNNGPQHRPQITEFYYQSNFGAFVIKDYFLRLNHPNRSIHDFSGYEIRRSIGHPKQLVVAGHAKTRDFTPQLTTNTETWILEYNPSNGNSMGLMWPTNATDFEFHGGDLLTANNNIPTHPYIFNQELLSYRVDKKGYVLMGPRESGNNFGLDIVTTAPPANLYSCFEQIENTMVTTTRHTPINTQMYTNPDFQYTFSTPNHSNPSMSTSSGIPCLISKSGYTTEEQPVIQPEIIQGKDQSKYTIFPNPSNGYFQLKGFTENSDITVKIYNSLGEIILREQKYNEQIDLSNQPDGIYFIEVNGNNQIHTIRFIKE